MPATKKIIDNIIVPDAKIARGTRLINLVLRYSSITTDPESRESNKKIKETEEKNRSGL